MPPRRHSRHMLARRLEALERALARSDELPPRALEEERRDNSNYVPSTHHTASAT